MILSFEQGWTDVGPAQQGPNGWAVDWGAPGDPLHKIDNGDNPGDTQTHVGSEPEIVHKHNNQLPEDQRLGGSDALVLDGDYTLNIFAAAGAFHAFLWCNIDAPAGSVVTVTVPVNTHEQGNGDTGAAYWMVELDGIMSPWLTFKRDFADREWFRYTISKTQTGTQPMTLWLEFESHTVAGIDFFIDAIEVAIEPSEPEPDPQRGAPRVQYERIVNVVPDSASLSRYLDICDMAWARGRQTVTGSYDDAGIGDLDARNAILWDIPQSDRQAYLDFYAEHYPGVIVQFDGTGSDPTPPPLPPDEPQYTLRSDNLIGLHSGFAREMTRPYVEQSGTTLQKFFSAGDAYRVKKLAPDALAVWRKYVGNESGRIYEHDTIKQAAAWYLDQYATEIEVARKNMGLTLEQFLARPIAIESLNETIPTYAPGKLQDAVIFDVWFAELAHERYGDAIQTVLLNGAIGNPHESEVHYLLPAAKAAYDHGDFIGYHAYWTANPERTFIGEHWPYHAGRWQEWDKAFRESGIYPRYASTEGGIVYSPDGVNFNSGKGWKSCGSFERYLLDINVFNALCLEWNREHGNRFTGLTLFAYGQWGWDDFELGDGEVKLLMNWADRCDA